MDRGDAGDQPAELLGQAVGPALGPAEDDALPGPVAATSQAAFTFPGFRFEAMGEFVADTSSDACTDPVIGTQKVTRLASWAVRPAGVDDELSDIARVASVSDLFIVDGQAFYLSDVA